MLLAVLENNDKTSAAHQWDSGSIWRAGTFCCLDIPILSDGQNLDQLLHLMIVQIAAVVSASHLSVDLNIAVDLFLFFVSALVETLLLL